MTFPKNRSIILICVIFIFIIATGLWFYSYLQKETAIQDKEVIQIPSGGQKDAEIIETETVICNNETYIFDTVMLDDGFYNDIYKTSRLAENFIVRVKAPRGGGGVFSILAVPKKDCDRVYLTTAIQDTDAQRGFIFEWSVGEKVVHELAVSEEFWGRYVSYPHSGKETVSLDGEKMIVAQPSGPASGEQCNLRSLHLLNLRDGTSNLVVQVSEVEAFNNSGFFDDFGYCGDLGLGWQDESTIYYDIYKATDEWNRPFIERRTLKIE